MKKLVITEKTKHNTSVIVHYESNYMFVTKYFLLNIQLQMSTYEFEVLA